MGGSVPDIPGVEVEETFAKSLRWEVSQLVGRDNQHFPGAQPVSFARSHINMLQTEDFFVCEKSDGIRCLLYCTVDEGGSEAHYLIDRKNAYYYLQGLHFPLPDDIQSFHVATLIDGELVNDTMPDGSVQLKYLVFDCLTLDGDRLMQRTLDKRIAYFTDKVFTPYEKLYKEFPEEIQYLPFLVEFKKMERSYGIEMMFKDILPKLLHGNDGLIFTCRTSPYKFGTDEHILKWKPESENTIDFRLNLDFPLLEPESDDEGDEEALDYDAMPIMNLSVTVRSKGREKVYEKYSTMYMTPEEWEHMKSLNKPLEDTIVECAQDDQGRWRFFRFRDDKTDANHISTVESIIESIHDRVSERDLVMAAKKIKDGWRKRQNAQDSRDASELERAKKRAEAHQRREAEELNHSREH
ncbi:MAG: Dcp1p-Dcp2p decapping enzyme complex alpha subunit [Sclerophora amabilis]|nr:MAG: Dcp1p-Dcp2p decapping enzyme complex alpha subunit [Sclerophora amabilis]